MLITSFSDSPPLALAHFPPSPPPVHSDLGDCFSLFSLTFMPCAPHIGIADRSVLSVPSLFPPPLVLFVSGSGHSPLLLASKYSHLPLLNSFSPAYWKSLHCSCLTCQKQSSSHLPLLDNLDRKGPGLGFSKPRNREEQDGPGRSWRPHGQGHPVSVSTGKLE